MLGLIQPWTAHDVDHERLTALAASVVGQGVVSVRYVLPAEAQWPHGHRHDMVAHEVDMGVEFVLTGETVLAMSWAMRGLDEGLAVALRGDDRPDADPLLQRTDVSGRSEWHDRMGKAVTGMAVAWHVPNEGRPPMPWAYRLEFAGGASAVVALGEMKGELIGYQPDGIVVIFDEATARAYRTADGGHSAWGEVLRTAE